MNRSFPNFSHTLSRVPSSHMFAAVDNYRHHNHLTQRSIENSYPPMNVPMQSHFQLTTRNLEIQQTRYEDVQKAITRSPYATKAVQRREDEFVLKGSSRSNRDRENKTRISKTRGDSLRSSIGKVGPERSINAARVDKNRGKASSTVNSAHRRSKDNRAIHPKKTGENELDVNKLGSKQDRTSAHIWPSEVDYSGDREAISSHNTARAENTNHTRHHKPRLDLSEKVSDSHLVTRSHIPLSNHLNIISHPMSKMDQEMQYREDVEIPSFCLARSMKDDEPQLSPVEEEALTLGRTILGPMFYVPTIKIFLELQASPMSRMEWYVVRRALETNEKARTDIFELAKATRSGGQLRRAIHSMEAERAKEVLNPLENFASHVMEPAQTMENDIPVVGRVKEKSCKVKKLIEIFNLGNMGERLKS